MNETLLGIRGADAVLDAVRRCWASLYGQRSIYYRARRGYGQADTDIAVVVQRQIESTRAGVMFTIDPASLAEDRLVIEGSFGLGETVVGGRVAPDRYVVEKASRRILERQIHHKDVVIESSVSGGTVTRELSPEDAMRPTLCDEETLAIADLGIRIQQHYGTPQDTEWAIDPEGRIWMVQSRPVTTAGRAAVPTSAETAGANAGGVLARGLGASPGIAQGPARTIGSLSDEAKLQQGDVLVAKMTTPDWVPLMRRACAIVTERGGATCHAAIVARELGVPCVVGADDVTTILPDGAPVRVDGARGLVLEPSAELPVQDRAPVAVAAPLITSTLLLVNLSEPSQAERVAALDVDGVGLVRAELMALEALDRAHPRQLIEEGRGDEFSGRMAAALGQIAQAFSPRPVTYRTLDFRSNEFAGLRGGDRFEQPEANPMIGYRGALRNLREPDVFRLELAALRSVWEQGARNLHVMLPFVRTAGELAACRRVMEEAGMFALPGFELWVMAEVPSVLFELPRYAQLGIAGISIGSNDLTQLLLGVDRDSSLLARFYDEREPAVVMAIEKLVRDARGLGLRTSICGQAPSRHAEYAGMLVRAGIDAISVTPTPSTAPGA